MTVSVQDTLFRHVGNGVTTSFAYNCQVLQPNDLFVYVDGAEVTSGITKNGIGNLTGGTVVFSVAPANGAAIILEREVALERTTDYQQNGDFLARVVNPDFNRIWMAVQQQFTNIARTISFPKGDVAPIGELPLAADRVDKLLSFDSSGNPIAVAPVAGTATALSLVLASSTGSGNVGFLQSGTGAVARTLQDKSRDHVNFFDFMTTAQRAACENRTGLVDLYAACQAAIDSTDGPIEMSPGLYPLSQQLIVRGNCAGIIASSPYWCTFEKRFNGNSIKSQTDGAVLVGFGLNGVGATYSGGGILPEGYNTEIYGLRVDDTADSPFVFNAAVGTNVGTGTYTSIRNCFARPTNAATTFAIRSLGVDDATRPTCRVFDNISGGSSLVDFSGMNFATLTNSLGTLVKFSTNSGKINMNGVRITTGSNIVVYGVDHVLDQNILGFSAGVTMTIDSTAANVTYGPGNAMSINGVFGKSPTLNAAVGAAMPNYIHGMLTTYAFGWYGAGGNPVIGNASTFAYYKLSGSMCHTTFGMTVGTTTVAGTGEYSFQLPFKAFVPTIGTALVKTSGGAYYEATFIVQGGASVGIIYLSDGITAAFASTSIAFGTNATLNVTIDYLVAPT